MVIDCYIYKEKKKPFVQQLPEKKKLLIINDSSTLVSMIKYMLEFLGVEVIGQNKAPGTITTILGELPDLILLDIEMFLLDGMALCTILKKNPSITKMSNIPILFFSSINEQLLALKVKECNAQGYICKDWTNDRIIEKILQQLF